MCGNVQTAVPQWFSLYRKDFVTVPHERGHPRTDMACTKEGGSLQCRHHGFFSSTFLPYSGEPIDFQLEDREEPIHGTFDKGVFHSRWANYEVARVQSWRQALIDPAHELIVEPHSAAGRKAFAALAHVALRLMGRSHRVVPAAAARNHAPRTIQSAQCVIGATGPVMRRTHSNQISS